MKGYWFTFEQDWGGYCEGETEADAKRIAEHLTGRKVTASWTIPYPSFPVIWQFCHPISGKVPPFCRDPRGCKGFGYCPKERACND